MAAANNTYFPKKISLLNVIATFMIVVLHAETPLRFGKDLSLEATPFVYSIYTLVQVAVPLFFFISGLLFFYNCEWNDIPKKLFRRIFSLLLPFIIWNLFFVTVFWAISKVPAIADKMNAPADLSSARAWFRAIWHTKYTPLWFIKSLMIYCLCAPAVLLLIRNRYVGISATLALFIVCAVSHWSDFYSMFYWMPQYMSGAVIGKMLYSNGCNADRPLFREKQATVFGLILPVILAVLYLLTLHDQEMLLYFRFISPICIWFLTDCLAGPYIRDRFVVKKWMGYTFFIYATHQFLLNVEQTLIRTYLPNTMTVINLTFIITPVVTFVLIVLIANWLSRYKFYKYLTGGR